MKRDGWRRKVGGRLETAFETLLGVLILAICVQCDKVEKVLV